MSNSTPDGWDAVEVMGGYTPSEYEQLPEEYRVRVAELQKASADRAERRCAGTPIDPEEMDAAGSAENKIRIPYDVAAACEEMRKGMMSEVVRLMIADREHLIALARERMREIGLERYAEDRAHAVRLVVFGARVVAEQMGRGFDDFLNNPWKHGNTGDVRKTVTVRRRHLPPDTYQVQVQDEGHGFDPAELKSPLEMLEADHGRGFTIIDDQLGEQAFEAGGTVATATTRLRARFVRAIARYERVETLAALELEE